MKICLIGASSYVGARLYFDLKSKYQLVGTYNSNKLSDSLVYLDITKEKDVANFIKNEKPEYIIHVANNASNGWCDTHKDEAHQLNVTSTEYIVNEANKINSKIIYISSVAAIDPTNYYGETKRDSENIIKKTKAGWVILQPSLIVGYSPNTTNDRPFNRILKNIFDNVPAQYDNCWQFQPTWIGQIAEVTDFVIDKELFGVSIPMVCEEYTTRFEIAKSISDNFNVPTIAIEKDASSKDVDLSSVLKEMELPIYSVKYITDKIIEEIRNKDIYAI